MQIVDVLEKYLGQLTADGRSRHTIRQYGRHVRTLAAWAADVGHSGRVREITHEDLARFLASDHARTSARGGEKKASSLNCLRRSVSLLSESAGHGDQRDVCAGRTQRGGPGQLSLLRRPNAGAENA